MLTPLLLAASMAVPGQFIINVQPTVDIGELSNAARHRERRGLHRVGEVFEYTMKSQCTGKVVLHCKGPRHFVDARVEDSKVVRILKKPSTAPGILFSFHNITLKALRPGETRLIAQYNLAGKIVERSVLLTVRDGEVAKVGEEKRLALELAGVQRTFETSEAYRESRGDPKKHRAMVAKQKRAEIEVDFEQTVKVQARTCVDGLRFQLCRAHVPAAKQRRGGETALTATLRNALGRHKPNLWEGGAFHGERRAFPEDGLEVEVAQVRLFMLPVAETMAFQPDLDTPVAWLCTGRARRCRAVLKKVRDEGAPVALRPG